MLKARQITYISVSDNIRKGITVYGVDLCDPKNGICTINDLSVSDYFEMVANENCLFWIIEEEKEEEKILF